MLRSFLAALAVLSVTTVFACGGDDRKAVDSDRDGIFEAQPADENGCCPRDEGPQGCMYTGGFSSDGMCYRACDFFCSENWRVVKEEHGCERWAYDTRTPRAGENSSCFAIKPFDAGVDARADAEADARADADAAVPE